MTQSQLKNVTTALANVSKNEVLFTSNIFPLDPTLLSMESDKQFIKRWPVFVSK